jgi:hypothetical protein
MNAIDAIDAMDAGLILWERLSSLDDHGQKPVPTYQPTNSLTWNPTNPTNPMNSINPEHIAKGYATVNSRLIFNKGDMCYPPHPLNLNPDKHG